ncbi:hypothetical protein L6164_008325 [Bauhinia variegata]|uniref:Uncharacterized protein n=2 Tax=Bauhinia variegata TaxID=167791 RepID=A0ACB9PFI3_BAUVA|nr:hypothetical protein L6164_008325 [Bauhinia variegata]
MKEHFFQILSPPPRNSLQGTVSGESFKLCFGFVRESETMTGEDLERGGGTRNRANNSNYSTAASETQWTSWLVPMFVVANIAVFIVAMYINNCPKHNFGFPGGCMAKFLGRFSFQPLQENPLFGPSSSTLTKMGALKWDLVVQHHQGWRLITCISLHAGVIHLVVHMLSLLFMGILRIGIIYLLSGFSSSVVSSLFIRNISVGASWALFGLLGSMLSELVTNWTICTNKAAALLTLLVMIVINLAIGILPRVDNFADIGGFLTGFLLGFILLPRLKSKYKAYQYVLWVVSLALLVIG